MAELANGHTLNVLTAIWADVLGVKKVKPDDNFFALGGHSLLGVRLVGAVREKLKFGDELKISDLADYPTLAAFSAHLESLAAAGGETGEI